MNRRDYAASHQYILEHPETRVLLYPSCRDPEKGDNYAIFDQSSLAKHIGNEQTISFYFDPTRQSIFWIDIPLKISWKQVQ
jgi:hypothetical protein